MTKNEAHEHALAYIGVKVIAFGVTKESLRHRKPEGFASPVEPGYELAHGRITVPGLTKPEPHYTFRTDDLIEDLANGQGDMFSETT